MLVNCRNSFILLTIYLTPNNRITMRYFKTVILIVYLSTLASVSGLYSQTNVKIVDAISDSQDSIIFNEIIQWWKLQNIDSKRHQDNIDFVAKYLLNTPYVEKTLEVGEQEQLVVNLREMDCVTYVENVLAITATLKKTSPYWNDFKNSLLKIRYRDGKIVDYSSRLHYTTDWLQEKVENGSLILVSDYLGSKEMDTKVSFMTKNSHLYPQLKDNNSLISKMQIIENKISSDSMKYIDKEEIETVESFIKDGDIIGFVSSVKGLDISHVGFASIKNSRVFLLHASPLTKQVSITDVPLADYLEKNSSVLGIVVGRVQ